MKRVRASGFTLIEMMVVIAITSILLLIGIPSMKSLIERNAVAGHVNALVGSITLARAEAIKRNAPVVLCRSNNADTTATPSCAGSNGDWKSGWIVFLDRNADGQFQTNEGDVLLRVEGTITSSGGITQNSPTKLQFRGTGLLASGMSTFTFKSKSEDANQQRTVVVSKAGRTHLED